MRSNRRIFGGESGGRLHRYRPTPEGERNVGYASAPGGLINHEFAGLYAVAAFQAVISAGDVGDGDPAASGQVAIKVHGVEGNGTHVDAGIAMEAGLLCAVNGSRVKVDSEPFAGGDERVIETDGTGLHTEGPAGVTTEHTEREGPDEQRAPGTSESTRRTLNEDGRARPPEEAGEREQKRVAPRAYAVTEDAPSSSLCGVVIEIGNVGEAVEEADGTSPAAEESAEEGVDNEGDDVTDGDTDDDSCEAMSPRCGREEESVATGKDIDTGHSCERDEKEEANCHALREVSKGLIPVRARLNKAKET